MPLKYITPKPEAQDGGPNCLQTNTAPPQRSIVLVTWVLPPKEQSILGVLLRAIYTNVIFIMQLLLTGGSTQLITYLVTVVITYIEVP